VSFRGELVDVGGRQLRVVRAGAGPLVVLEHGAFGCATDWTVVQDKLAQAGFRSLAYDRAGLGRSDPGPKPRDGAALAADLDILLAALGETGPFILAGHSMAGLLVRHYAQSRPARVQGLVMVDAVMTRVMDEPGGPAAVRAFGRLLHLTAFGARLGLMRPISLFSASLIGLTGDAAREKRRIHGSAEHAKGAAAEVAQWPAMSDLAAVGSLPRGLPVAVVTAGGAKLQRRFKAMQAEPALASGHGFVEDVPGAKHASLLGPRYADAVVRGVRHVAQAGSRARTPQAASSRS
jgi:pimeloyl-ACP methyl ester carboxylesterase